MVWICQGFAALGKEGFRAVLQVKNNKGLFPKDYVEKALEDMPGGVHIVLKGTAPNGIELLVLGYRYSTKTTFFLLPQLMQDLQGLVKSMK